MFLKLKEESYGYPSWLHSEDKDYPRAEGIYKNLGQRTAVKQIKLNVGQKGTEPKQDANNTCYLSEFHELNKSMY